MRKLRSVGLGILLPALALTMTACSSSGSNQSSSTTTAPTTTTRTPGPTTTWLCAPGLASNPCTGNLDYSSVPAAGPTTLTKVTVAKNPPIDCFYAYGAVSPEPTANSDLVVGPSEVTSAQTQAAPFSQDCRIFAPMYQEITQAGLYGLVANPTNPSGPASIETAYQSLKSGFEAFLALEPKGKHFTLLGHSEGAAMLIRLIQEEIDTNPALRQRLVSAILIGANLTVAPGKTTGGAFQHIPLCTSAAETGCVIAYSSFYAQPPADTNFGIPGQGIGLLWGQTQKTGLQIACVNPAQLRSQTNTLDNRFQNTSGPVPYVSYPGLYSGTCQTTQGVTFFNISTAPPSTAANANIRPLATSSGGWGLHQYDINLTMGDLVTIVATQAKSVQK